MPFRSVIRRKMKMLARAIGGRIDDTPDYRYAYTSGTLLIEDARLLVMGTSLPHHLIAGHAQQVALRHGFDVIVLRIDAGLASCDFYFHERRAWLTDYRRWDEHPGLVFAPRTGMQKHLVQATPSGLMLQVLGSVGDGEFVSAHLDIMEAA